MLNIFKKLFKSKKEKDVAALKPVVEKINAEYAKLRNISDDELRGKTREFKQKIEEYVKSYREKQKQLEAQIREAEQKQDIKTQEELYEQLEKLKKDRNQAYEEILEKLLPEAFAVVKETCRRFAENKQIVVTATDWDREIASRKSNVIIEGDKAIWKNKWEVRGQEVEWNMVHYDVQLMGGIVLHQGKIAEMATGEGKTLVATLPAYLNALPGEGTHIVTVNDYLAKRDTEWNGPIFEFHGLTVDCIDSHQPHTPQRRQAYLADITYGTNNEFGFDYLRDNMAHDKEEMVQRDHHYAIIDEIDSVLIDEARTPLIISGPIPSGEKDKEIYESLRPRVERLYQQQRREAQRFFAEAKRLLEKGDKKKAGELLFRIHRALPKYKPLLKLRQEPGINKLLLDTEAFYLQDHEKNMHLIDEHIYFAIDEKNNQVELTDKGRDFLTDPNEDPDFFVVPHLGDLLMELENDTSLSKEEKTKKKQQIIDEFTEKTDRLHAVHQLLKAYTLFERDVDYIVQGNKVMIVDEHTGRVMEGRRYSDGLHQAIEAKERVKVEAGTQTFATITLQNYFRMYHKLAGMTGTAETEANEFHEIYKLDVVVIPTNKPVIREDKNDLIYRTKREKYNAIIEEIVRLREAGRPVLVGTTSVETSELLSRMLRQRRIPHEVLNAKHHEKEAEIVAKAGEAPYDEKTGKRLGNITIATNMAGRGTDIKLGEGVKEAGGLAIIGSERHDSRRIDLQLRGRAGRQGDPGSSQFFLSMEDDLIRLFGGERTTKLMDRFNLSLKEGEVIEHPLINKVVSRAQKKVEQNNFAIRKRLLEYDDVMNQQREVIYKKRQNLLEGKRFKVDFHNMLHDYIEMLVREAIESNDPTPLNIEILKTLGIDPELKEADLEKYTLEELTESLLKKALEKYNKDKTEIAKSIYEQTKYIKQQNPDALYLTIFFQSGNNLLSIVVDMNEILNTQGQAAVDTLERQVMLSIIDDEWKDFLREMDDLKHSVQMAVFEQKDPLVVYKQEAFYLFMQMLRRLNERTLSLLFKATPTNPPEHTRRQLELEEKRRQQENKKIKEGKGDSLLRKNKKQQIDPELEAQLQGLSRAERRRILKQHKKKKKKRK